MWTPVLERALQEERASSYLNYSMLPLALNQNSIVFTQQESKSFRGGRIKHNLYSDIMGFLLKKDVLLSIVLYWVFRIHYSKV